MEIRCQTASSVVLKRHQAGMDRIRRRHGSTHSVAMQAVHLAHLAVDRCNSGEPYETHRAGGSTSVDCMPDSMKRADLGTHGHPAQTVLIVTSGGLEHGGGIGRQMGYFLQA